MIKRTPPHTPRDRSLVHPKTNTDSSPETPPTPSLSQFLSDLLPGLQSGPGSTKKPSHLVNTNLTSHAEAKLWLQKAREAINTSRNLKTELKVIIEKSLQKLYILATSSPSLTPTQQSDLIAFTAAANTLTAKIEEHTKLLQENKNNMSQISNKINSLNKPHIDTPTKPRKETAFAPSYATIAATTPPPLLNLLLVPPS
ncbi:unnamed protein product [Pieris brassicae]|uniref:Uncharacterized protein n=1 Tax=Pieris brassicae TaxID=7116 RepID=A0A9P0TMM1_PIEBR|nr:unnamed protein product [Pieris brassicae]